ncbi:MAG: hypothetical protein WD844_15100 [Thermoleophilaceae bacterium]
MSQHPRRHGRLYIKLLAAVACAAALPAIAPAAEARGPLATIVQDDAQLLQGSDAQVAERMRMLRSLGVDRVRLTANWSVLAPDGDSRSAPAFDAADPGAYPDPWGFWANLDRAVRQAHAAGLEPMIDLGFWAPLWATQGDPGEGRAVWNVDPAAYGDFVKAVVRRYSGAWAPEPEEPEQPAAPEQCENEEEASQDQALLLGLFGSGADARAPECRRRPEREPAQQPERAAPLPEVSWWTIWNEPNHPGFLQPQWKAHGDGLRPYSAHLYRRLVQVAYPAIKGIMAESTVLIGGTSSTGARWQNDVQDGTPPLEFLRTLACVDSDYEPLRVPECDGYRPVLGDGFSHHPYSLMHQPDHEDRRHPDDVRIGGLERLTDALDLLADGRRIDGRLRDVYLTEFGYETNPPDPKKPWGLDEQARWLAWSEFLAYDNRRVKSYPQFLLRDLGTVSAAAAARGKRPYGDWQSGLLFEDGSPKPSLTSFRYTLHATCVTARVRRKYWRRGLSRTIPRRVVMLWGHVRPGSGRRELTVGIERRGEEGRAATVTSRGRAARRRYTAQSSAREPFATNTWGYFRRYVRFRRGAEYRVQTADGKALGLPVAPVDCEREPRR